MPTHPPNFNLPPTYNHVGIPPHLHAWADNYVNRILAQSCPRQVREHATFRRLLASPLPEQRDWQENLHRFSSSALTLSRSKYNEHALYLSLFSQYGSAEGVIRYLDATANGRIPAPSNLPAFTDRGSDGFDRPHEHFRVAQENIVVSYQYLPLFYTERNQEYAVKVVVIAVKNRKSSQIQFDLDRPIGSTFEPLEPHREEQDTGAGSLEKIYFFQVSDRFRIRYRYLRPDGTPKNGYSEVLTIPTKND
ncbi:hypothetical protein PM082_014618 [Marasmius tenuissimus]|nr:hypothetical protein PM082_014618 [Marasmius tenuissimus]